MEEKASGIVLSAVNYGESDKILNIFTLEQGVVSAKIKGVKKAGAKLRFSAEPFCFAEYVFAEKAGKRTVTGASLIDSFYPLREDLKKLFAAGAVTEFIKKFVREGMAAEELFLISVNALKTLAYGEASPAGALAAFLTEGLKYSGYALNTEGCRECGEEPDGRVFFDAENGSFLCEKCASGALEINFSTYAALKALKDGVYPEGQRAKNLLKLLDYYMAVKPEENLKALKELIKLL